MCGDIREGGCRVGWGWGSGAPGESGSQLEMPRSSSISLPIFSHQHPIFYYNSDLLLRTPYLLSHSRSSLTNTRSSSVLAQSPCRVSLNLPVGSHSISLSSGLTQSPCRAHSISLSGLTQSPCRFSLNLPVGAHSNLPVGSHSISLSGLTQSPCRGSLMNLQARNNPGD